MIGETNNEHIDVLIVGAGLSGIAAAYYVQTRSPQKSYAILEGRDAIGGTWDLFRYPGVRSDSDMYTLGYTFYPWEEPTAIADADLILNYIRNAAAEFGIDQTIRYGHRVTGASWSSATARWTVDVALKDGSTRTLTTNFLFMCTGYYDYAQGYSPAFAGVERFQGQIVHPQHWPQDLDYAGKRVVVIGSGATAVTLVPAMAKDAAHVTMLQRSPSYIVAQPSEDAIANWLHRVLPSKTAHGIARWKAILQTIVLYYFTRWFPETAKQGIVKQVEAEIGPGYDVETHFTPTYNPWDQRLCLVPDADLFKAIKADKAAVVTDHIETFTETGIQLKSGRHLSADIVVTATGLVMRLDKIGTMTVDGDPVHLGNHLSYKGMMLSDVPNAALTVGYTNASWTLKAELIAEYVCRIVNHMDEHGYDIATPRRKGANDGEMPIVNFTSGYIKRAMDNLPRQGEKRPWKLYQNYILDMVNLRYGTVDDGTMTFTKATEAAPHSTLERSAVAGD